MMWLAAEGDTWGVTGPDFLRFYVVSAVALVLFSLLNRYLAFNTGSYLTRNSVQPEELSYLAGGPRLAVLSSLAALRMAGAVAAERGRLQTAGRLPGDAGSLDQAVYDAVGRGVRQQDLAGDYRVVARLDLLRETLESGGLLLSQGRRRRARLGSFLLLALFVVGVARVVAGLGNERPIGFIAALTVVVLILAGIQLRLPMVSKEGRELLKSTRAANSHLSPDLAPAGAVYGVNGAAMGVALFGAASLWAADPSFAAEAEIQRKVESSGWGGTGDGGGGGDGGDGGGGCGGGGCGG